MIKNSDNLAMLFKVWYLIEAVDHALEDSMANQNNVVSIV